jgi:Xaa-Pro dipeptidase
VTDDSTILIAEDLQRPLPTDPVTLKLADPVHRRRADVEAKLAELGRILPELGCEAVVLFMPAHVAWLCGGFNTRGLFADTERPGIYTNGKQRWLICSNLDSQRLFDEELDRLGFQIKEWHWTTGRAALLGELTAGKKIAADRPFPNMPLINEKLRTIIRPLTEYDLGIYRKLGLDVAHAIEAAARNCPPGETEAEIAGHIAHRLLRHGIEVVAVSVSGQTPSQKYPRPGLTNAVPTGPTRLQATGSRDGLFVTCARTVCFGKPADDAKRDHDFACKLSAAYRSLLLPEETFATVSETARKLTLNTPYEFDHRDAQLGYGTGRLNAEELRRMGLDERFQPSQAIVTQARAGHAMVVDTLIAAPQPQTITPSTDWPYKRIKIGDKTFDIPEMLVRDV